MDYVLHTGDLQKHIPTSLVTIQRLIVVNHGSPETLQLALFKPVNQSMLGLGVLMVYNGPKMSKMETQVIHRTTYPPLQIGITPASPPTDSISHHKLFVPF